MSNELKPCQFCGTEPTMTHGATDDYQIACRGKQCFGPVTSGYCYASDAIAAWNTRTDATKDAEIERLRGALKLAIDLIERDVIRVRPSDNEELISAYGVWNSAMEPKP